jgi:predicted CoA-binding protein
LPIALHPTDSKQEIVYENREAAALLTDAGIDVVMNRCIKRDHARLFG